MEVVDGEGGVRSAECGGEDCFVLYKLNTAMDGYCWALLLFINDPN